MAPPTQLPEHFTYLQYLRLRRGFSREGFAREVIRVTRTTHIIRGFHIGRIEEGVDTPSDEELALFARALNYSPASNLLRPVKVVLPDVEAEVTV